MSRAIRCAWDLGFQGPGVAIDLPDLTDFEGFDSLVIRLRPEPAHLKDAAQVAFVAELCKVPYSMDCSGVWPGIVAWMEDCWHNLIEGEGGAWSGSE